MTRYHTKGTFDENGKQTGQENVPFTEQEEADKNAEEATWEAEKPARDLAELRRERNDLLVSSDWTQYNDSPLDDETKDDWAIYRQELRDLPATTDDPAEPTWPEVPE